MASKVLVPAAPFAKLQVKKSPPESSGSGFIIGGDATARVAHLEHSVRFLQEQHRLMLSGLHTEIEALRERNRDLQFQLIFNKESSPKLTLTTPSNEEIATNNEEAASLKREVSRLEREAAAARGEARAAEARALQLQRLVDVQAEKLRELEIRKCENCCAVTESTESVESRAELRARLAEAERLVRRLRSDAERQRREVLAAGAGGVTNLLFDSAAASHAHLQCMKNSLHASLRGVDAGFYNNYHFPPVHTPDFWREPLREDFSMVANRGRGGARRPLTLPELSGQQIHRSTVYANNHTRPRAYGYENKNKKPLGANGESATKSCEESPELHRFKSLCTNDLATDRFNLDPIPTYPELKVVVTKLLPQDIMVSNGQTADSSGARARPRRNHHRKHATTDHS